MTTSSTRPSSDGVETPVAVVTGTRRGLGLLLACALACRGHNLVVNARSCDDLAAAAPEVRSRGVQVVEVAGDVSDPEVAEWLVTAATAELGRLDVLVANAGVIQVRPVQVVRPDDFAEAMDVMYWASCARPSPRCPLSGPTAAASWSSRRRDAAPRTCCRTSPRSTPRSASPRPADRGGARGVSVTVDVADTPRLPTPVTDVWDWQMRGACREMNSALFFHPEGERGPTRARRETHAKLICRSCAVLVQCRAHALAVHKPYGVWGGLSESERAEIVRAQDRTPRLLSILAPRPTSS